jgi:GxxExxY protein
MDEREELDSITKQVIGGAIDVHRALGPGLMESVYETCLASELIDRGISVERQKGLPVTYKEITLESGYRLDLLVDGKVIVEIKAVELLSPLHKSQLLTYLKLSGLRVGLLINFNVTELRKGVQRIVNNY